MKKFLDLAAIIIILLAFVILWASWGNAHNLDQKKQSYYFLVLLGNQNIFQFTEKSDCEAEMDRLNNIIGWKYKAICVETKFGG